MMKRSTFLALAAIPMLAGCWIAIGESFNGYSVAPSDAGVDAGGDASNDATSDATSDAGSEGACNSAAVGDCGPCATDANIVCDPCDNKCKPDRSNVGEPCVIDVDADSCGAPNHKCLAGADGFHDGYCTLTPCSATALCPIGATCAFFRGEIDQAACYKNCNVDTDCRTAADYGCFELGKLLKVSGAGTKVCHPNPFQCTVTNDCPPIKPTCDAGFCVN
jgi:hypothetical protein